MSSQNIGHINYQSSAARSPLPSIVSVILYSILIYTKIHLSLAPAFPRSPCKNWSQILFRTGLVLPAISNKRKAPISLLYTTRPCAQDCHWSLITERLCYFINVSETAYHLLKRFSFFFFAGEKNAGDYLLYPPLTAKFTVSYFAIKSRFLGYNTQP